ncbi:histidine kinase [Piscinibacter sakaiensis]|uniref:sensor histidine kinase n=1 Tax=Piscinibacter sakaiensis TaxID=1547922 RepID=UPI003AAD7E06
MRHFPTIDPRRSLAAAIAWLVIGLSIGLVIVANLSLRGHVRQTLLEQHGQRLESAVEHVGSELDTALILRLQSVTTVAAMLSDQVEPSEPEQLQRRLAAVLREVPDLSWLAVTDANGDIVAATDRAVIGSNVYQYAWLSQGLDIAWVEEAVSPGARFLKLTAPVRNADGAIAGVVAARMSWDWVQQLTAGIDSSPGQWLLIDRDGVVRRGPPALLGRNWRDMLADITPFDPVVAGLGTDASDLPTRIQVRRLSGGYPHLLARADTARHQSLQKLGWQIVVIEPVAAVAAFATDIEWRITLTLLLLGVVAAFAGVWMARRLTRRISVIARSADAVQAGRADRIEIPPGRDEAARLGSALNRLLSALQRERDDLRRLNVELDQRVAQRTEQIRRLAMEAREAAVGRERLRLARDLHDTLAHSMMAMLTEIRMLKRLASTQPAALSDELVRAEQAALEGLREARLAIAQMRSSPVRDIGLAAALADLVKGFGERTGITVAFRCDHEVAPLTDERGETLFRMVEELLRNVQRHSGAHHLTVTLRGAQHDESLLLEVADDGIGFDPQVVGAGHYGLVGLHEQADMIGATVTIASADQQGTVVAIELDPRTRTLQ